VFRVSFSIWYCIVRTEY